VVTLGLGRPALLTGKRREKICRHTAPAYRIDRGGAGIGEEQQSQLVEK
jgi:hypothetical protein